MTYSCRKCGVSFLIPASASAKLKAEVAALLREHKPIASIKHWRDETGGDLVNAKATTYHITEQKGFCHRCNTKLLEGEITECAKCNSLNLDW